MGSLGVGGGVEGQPVPPREGRILWVLRWGRAPSQAAGPENTSSGPSEEEERVSHQPSAVSTQKSQRKTANGICNHRRVTLGAKQRAGDARGEGCGMGVRLPTSLFAGGKKKKSKVGEAERSSGSAQ